MANWVSIAKAADCPPGQAREIVAGDRVVALYNVDGRFYALDGICPHQGGPLDNIIQRGLDKFMLTLNLPGVFIGVEIVA